MLFLQIHAIFFEDNVYETLILSRRYAKGSREEASPESTAFLTNLCRVEHQPKHSNIIPCNVR